MKALLLLSAAVFLVNCNASKKDPNQVKDDTARMDHPPAPRNPPLPIEPVKGSSTDIPSAIRIKGKIQQIWRWEDSLGSNLLITSRRDPYDHKDEYGDEVQSAELHASHYVRKNGTDFIKLWEMSDTEKDCAFDITCAFLGDSPSITDLDRDGIAEITIPYSLACRSDVSPAYMKLVLHEDVNAYSLQGTMWIASEPGMKYDVTEANVDLEKLPRSKDETQQLLQRFGRYETEKEFAQAPPVFLSFARTEWLKYSKEKMSE